MQSQLTFLYMGVVLLWLALQGLIGFAYAKDAISKDDWKRWALRSTAVFLTVVVATVIALPR